MRKLALLTILMMVITVALVLLGCAQPKPRPEEIEPEYMKSLKLEVKAGV